MLATTKGKGIICGEHNFNFPAHMNYGIYFVERILNFKDKTALVNGVTGEELTFAEIVRQVQNVGASLTDLGMKKGDLVAVICENRNEFLTATLAAMCAGAVVTFINSAYTANELIHTAKITKPKYVFLSINAYKNHYKTLKNLEFISKILIIGDSPSTELTSYNELVNKQTDFASFTDYYGRVETALILYSSGTTGLPKGVKVTHVNLIATAQQKDPCPNLSMLSIAPWCNTLGFGTMSRALLNGRTVVYLPRFQEKLYLETIQKFKVQSIFVAPPLVVWLSKSQLIDNYDLKSVEIIYSGGAPLDETVIQQVKKRLPTVRGVLLGYGMTEAIGAVTEETEFVFRKGSIGKVVQGNVIKVALIFGVCGACRREELTNVSVKDIETHGDILLVKIPNTKNKIPRSFTIGGPFAEIVKKYQSLRSSKGKSDRFFQNFQRGRCTAQVVDVESRKILGPGQPGEVCINGVVVFDGYIGKSKSEDFDDDGFYKTGDIAYYDQDGFFYIIDRLKELIKYKGWQVSPAEIEGILLEHPAVRDVGVAGAPDPLAGELPTAFVVTQPGASVTEKELMEFVASKVSPWKQLRGGVRFVSEVPKNVSGKILRRILRDMLKTKSKI